MSPLHDVRLSLKNDIGPRASLASPSIFITPSDPRPFRMTVVTHALGNFLGSSTLCPFTSLKLWRTLNSFKSWGWTLCKRFRAPSSTRQMFMPLLWRGFSFFFMCFGTSSPELSMDELRCRFFGVVDGDAAAVTGGSGLVGGDSNGSGGGKGPFFFFWC